MEIPFLPRKILKNDLENHYGYNSIFDSFFGSFFPSGSATVDRFDSDSVGSATIESPSRKTAAQSSDAKRVLLDISKWRRIANTYLAVYFTMPASLWKFVLSGRLPFALDDDWYIHLTRESLMFKIRKSNWDSLIDRSIDLYSRFLVRRFRWITNVKRRDPST